MTKAKATRPAPVPAKPPSGNGIAAAVKTLDPAVRDDLRAAIGTKNDYFNVNLFVRTARTAHVFKDDSIDASDEDQVTQTATLVGMKAFKPTDPVEAMIAAQAVMLHNLAMETGRRSQLPNQHPDVASRMRRDAANLSRSMIDMTEALERRRGRGPQTIRVERVVVQDGGQAVVAGSVVGGGALPASAPSAPAIGQGAAPMPMLDVEPAAVGQGEGERDVGSRI